MPVVRNAHWTGRLDPDVPRLTAVPQDSKLHMVATLGAFLPVSQDARHLSSVHVHDVVLFQKARPDPPALEASVHVTSNDRQDRLTKRTSVGNGLGQIRVSEVPLGWTEVATPGVHPTSPEARWTVVREEDQSSRLAACHERLQALSRRLDTRDAVSSLEVRPEAEARPAHRVRSCCYNGEVRFRNRVDAVASGLHPSRCPTDISHALVLTPSEATNEALILEHLTEQLQWMCAVVIPGHPDSPQTQLGQAPRNLDTACMAIARQIPHQQEQI